MNTLRNLLLTRKPLPGIFYPWNENNYINSHFRIESDSEERMIRKDARKGRLVKKLGENSAPI